MTARYVREWPRMTVAAAGLALVLVALGVAVASAAGGIHVVLARSAGGASRDMLDSVLARLVESGAPALLLSGDPHQGPLLRGVRAEPLPPGRARLLRRRGRPALVQLAYAPPLERDAAHGLEALERPELVDH